ncbi:hypothetical protein [Nocardia sputorum]|uniref:hypothetical protein n=1 Tax=Nocardia sputorum TaxID=2984338 RepID=UPI00248FE4A6|nr:hypothetical protein [Nocardia sputorum]
MTVNVDPGDLALTDMAVQVVRCVAAETDAAHIVVHGFARLPRPSERYVTPIGFDILSEIADALNVLTEFTERLRGNGERVHLIPFGWNKNCRIEAFERPEVQRAVTLSAAASRIRPGSDVHGRDHVIF